MKVKIEIGDDNEEVIIRCKSLTPEIMKLQQVLNDEINKKTQFVLYNGETEYFIDLNKILFFETENSLVLAHTAKESYETRKKLYELEEMLP